MLASILCNNFTLALADDNMILNHPLKLQYLEEVQALENVIAKVILLRQIGNGRGFHTLQGLRVRVPGGQGGGPVVWTLVPMYP